MHYRGSHTAAVKDDQGAGCYWLTRIVFIRYLGLIYTIAFLVAYHQNAPLIGQNGLTPAKLWLERFDSTLPGSLTMWQKILELPTVFWFLEPQDVCLQAVAGVGAAISALLMVLGAANLPLMTLLWVLYHSVVSIGQNWYSFGWETQLLETGFLAMWLVPLWSLKAIKQACPPPLVCIWGCRWLVFRIMIGAGLIKVRGDSCWRDLTCMNYHYETQPVPNPLSWGLHVLPPPTWHTVETLANHIVELVLPWLLIGPRRARIWGGGVQAAFQLVLILSGNLSFLNWLTIAPCIFCFDDASLRWMFSAKTVSAALRANDLAAGTNSAAQLTTGRSKKHDDQCRGGGGSRDSADGLTAGPLARAGSWLRRGVNLGVFVLLFHLSVPVVVNLMSSRQSMNRSFDKLKIVNTYGAFGSITRQRYEVILKGTNDAFDQISDSTEWKEYEFKCKPGDPNRRPCIISPYHYRLSNPWLGRLAEKLMDKDKTRRAATASLLARDPFGDQEEPPRTIKADLYLYKFTTVDQQPSPGAEVGHWWTRTRQREYMPPVGKGSPFTPSVLGYLWA